MIQASRDISFYRYLMMLNTMKSSIMTLQLMEVVKALIKVETPFIVNLWFLPKSILPIDCILLLDINSACGH